jgi:hypothetical protein
MVSLLPREKYLCLKKIIAHDTTEKNKRIRRTALTTSPA